MIQIKPIEQTYTMEEIDAIVEEIYPGVEEFLEYEFGGYCEVETHREHHIYDGRRNFEFDRGKYRLLKVLNTLNRCNRIMAGNYTTPLTPEECDKLVLERKDAYRQLKEIVDIPTIKDTGRERQVFVRAINAGYMERAEKGYRWIKRKCELAYFVYKLYCPSGGERIHYKRIEALFSVSRLERALDAVLGAAKQPWREEIDKLFEED